LLGPILVIVIYFLTRELTSDNKLALMAAFVTSVSFHVLIGIYAGFYANLIALIFGYSGLVFLLRFLKRSGVVNLILFSGLTALLLFAHLYTWTVLTVAIFAFLIIMLRSSKFPKTRIFALIIVISLLVILDMGKMHFLGSLSGVQRDIEVAAQTRFGLDQFASKWTNLDLSMHLILGGLFGNFIIFFMGLYWLYRSNWRDPTSTLIMVFLSVGLLPFLFGDAAIQTRVYYNIPFEIPAGIALGYLMKKPSKILLPLSICIWLVSIALITVVNFYQVPI